MNSTLLVLAFGNLVIGTAAFIVAGIVGEVANDLAIPLATAGQFLTVYALTYAVASPLLASLTGSWPRRRVLLTGMLLVAAGCLASTSAPTAAVLFAARVVTALGAALFTPTAALVAVITAAPERRARALSWVFLGLSAAQVLGIPLGTWLAFTFGWRSAFLPVAAVALPAALAIALVVPATLVAPRTGFATWLEILRTPHLLLAISLTALLMTALFAPYTFFAPLLTALTGLQGTALTPLLWLFGIASMAGTLVGGWAADRFGSVAAMAVLMTVLLATFLAMPFAQGSIPVTAVLGLVWALFGFAFMTPQQSRLVTLAPTLQGALLALNASAIYVGTALGGALGGVVVARGGPIGLPFAAAAVVALTLVALWASVRLSAAAQAKRTI